MTRGHVNYRERETHCSGSRKEGESKAPSSHPPRRHNTYYMSVLQAAEYFVAIFQPGDTR